MEYETIKQENRNGTTSGTLDEFDVAARAPTQALVNTSR